MADRDRGHLGEKVRGPALFSLSSFTWRPRGCRGCLLLQRQLRDQVVLLPQTFELSLLCQLPWSQGVTSAPSLLVGEEPLLPTGLSVQHQPGSPVPASPPSGPGSHPFSLACVKGWG